MLNIATSDLNPLDSWRVSPPPFSRRIRGGGWQQHRGRVSAVGPSVLCLPDTSLGVKNELILIVWAVFFFRFIIVSDLSGVDKQEIESTCSTSHHIIVYTPLGHTHDHIAPT